MTKFKKALTLILSLSILSTNIAYSKIKTNENEIKNIEISKGINYIRKYVESTDRKNMYILTADLSNKGVGIIFSKAKDRVKKSETLTGQIEREILKGNDVVAGINADMFEMSTGFSTGPQITNGEVMTGFSSRSEENIYPVFGIDINGKPFIDKIHMQANLSVNDEKNIAIDNLNREKFKESLILLNYMINDERKIDYKDYYQNGALTLVKGINEPIKLGKEYEGTVVDLGIGKKEIIIPKDAVVIASHGKKFNWVKDNIKVGDKIKFKIDFDKQGIADVIGTYTQIVDDGKALTSQDMIKNGANSNHVSSKRARTAIGITSDNKVVSVVIDAGVNEGYSSDGATYAELGNILKSLGAYDAVVLDGGGSTQMNVKFPGESTLKIVNKLSDGRERALTNAILFVNKTQPSKILEKIVFENSQLLVYKNTKTELKINGYDTNYHKVDLSKAIINWKVEGNIGKVQNGVFIASNKASNGKITAEISGKKSVVDVTVVDKVSEIKIAENGLLLKSGDTKQFSIVAKYNGKTLQIPNEKVSWSVLGGIGSISSKGLFKANKKGTGQIIAKLDDKMDKASVYVDLDELLIDDFEHNDNSRYLAEGLLNADAVITNEKSKQGKYSLKTVFDLNEWDRLDNLTVNTWPTLVDKNDNNISSQYMSYVKPQKISFWAYGEGINGNAYINILDGNENIQKINLNSKIEKGKWTYITADIPDVTLPITFLNIAFTESDKALTGRANIYIDDIKFIYNDINDHNPPQFTSFKPGNIYSNKGRISVKVLDDKSKIDEKSLKVKIDGNIVKPIYDAENNIIYVEAKDLAAGSHTFSVIAADTAGNVSKEMQYTFNVILEEDTKAPVILNVYPVKDAKVLTNYPKISFKIVDDKSGISKNDIFVFLNSKQLKVYYDDDSGYGYALPAAELLEGNQTLTIYAKDKKGNVSDVYVTNFVVNNLRQPKSNEFTIDVFADTHTKYYLNELLDSSSKGTSDLILHVGDIVDSNNKDEWDGVKETLSSYSKQIIAAAGNHDVINGSDNFNSYFGGLSQVYNYGNTIIIKLDSSINNSIKDSDPTQYEFLKEILAKNKKKNIIIMTHIPTRDFINKSYSLKEEDRKLLESILVNYKSKNKDKNILVISGHQHIFKTWTTNGINYLISGNGSGKKYAKMEDGGYLSYTRLSIGNSIVIKNIPIIERIGIMNKFNEPLNKIYLSRGMSNEILAAVDFAYGSYNNIMNSAYLRNVDVKWESEDSNIVAVSNGICYAKNIGNTYIKVTIGDITRRIPVEVTEQVKEFTSIGFKDSLLKVENNKTYNLNLYGFDLYGNAHLIDTSKIKYEMKGKIGTIKQGKITIKAKKGAKSVVTATYGKLKATINLEVR
ncbi:Calcineurin-like phosphoesterase [Caloramator mitchellensis]|uniref:Calcineurin-like phosphoesterase n=1 Tax=Caloramator mitchellensis TaxID=908809 RepID=A0A0R3JUE8_CALMK|nr:phosphodiester glycosidase family protein [Caloramator mitchellensis]KRQ87187.1 Calcineurin-like phosphoesterase [Caloramator mitchellensis]